MRILLFKTDKERLLQLLKKTKTPKKDFLKTVQNILNQKILIFLKPKNLAVEVVLCSPLEK